MGAGRSEERPAGTATVSANISTHSLETKTDCLIIPNRRQNSNWKKFPLAQTQDNSFCEYYLSSNEKIT